MIGRCYSTRTLTRPRNSGRARWEYWTRVACTRRGFTFAELTIGLVVMSMIIGAVSVTLFTVADGWHATDSTETVSATTRQTSAQLYRMLRSAKYIGLATKDGQFINSGGGAGTAPAGGIGATVLFWRGDLITADGALQLGEIGLIQHDLASQTLRFWYVPASDGAASGGVTLADISDSQDALDLMSNCHAVYQVLAHNVTDVTFSGYNVGSTTQKSCVEFFIKYLIGGQESVEYGVVTLRGAQTPTGG